MAVTQGSEAGRLAPNPRGPLPRPRKLRERLGVSRERMGRLLDVSAKSIQRWEAKDAAPESVRLRRRLTLIDEIISVGLQVYTEEGFREFMTTPLPEFDNCTALQLIERDQEDRVLAALASDYEGLGY
jgi:transcriptional regulator with XRE-family HTH domain